jgi:hypothetical protein
VLRKLTVPVGAMQVVLVEAKLMIGFATNVPVVLTKETTKLPGMVTVPFTNKGLLTLLTLFS